MVMGGSHRRPHAPRCGRADRLLHQRSGAEAADRRHARVHRAVEAAPGNDPRCLCPSAHPVRDAGGGAQSRAEPEPRSAVSGQARRAEHHEASSSTGRSRAAERSGGSGRPGQADTAAGARAQRPARLVCERVGAAGRLCRWSGGTARICSRPRRSRGGARTSRRCWKGSSRRRRSPCIACHADAGTAAEPADRWSRAARRVSVRQVHPRAVRGAGGAQSGGAGGGGARGRRSAYGS